MDTLSAIPNRSSRISKTKLYVLLVILDIAVPSIEGLEVMFSRLKRALKNADARMARLASHVHNELNLLRYFVYSIGDRRTHLRDVMLISPTCTCATYASLTVMGEICHSSKGEHFY